MKIKDIAELARDAGGVTLINEPGVDLKPARQWLVIGGVAVYPLDGLPTLDENQLMAVLDVPMKKRDSYKVFKMELNDHMRQYTADYQPLDRDAELSTIEIGWSGMRLRCAMADDGETVFANTKWLKPVEDRKGDLTFVVRRSSEGTAHLVVKRGMMNLCCISSADIWIGDREAHEIAMMHEHARRAEEKNRQRAANDGK